MAAVQKVDSGPSANDLCHRALRLIDSTNNRLAEFERMPVTLKELLLGTSAEHLQALPLAELDQLSADLAQHLKDHGDSTEYAFALPHQLSDVAEQLRTTMEALFPYRRLLEKRP